MTHYPGFGTLPFQGRTQEASKSEINEYNVNNTLILPTAVLSDLLRSNPAFRNALSGGTPPHSFRSAA